MKIIGNPNGEYRGKMGGTVFSRNKSGAVARAYVRPTNRNSVAQQKARSRTGTASQGFATLTSTQASQWNAFAKSGFNPKKKMNVGQFSGANAYTALATTALNGVQNGMEAEIKQDTVAIDATAVFSSFAVSADAPVGGIKGSLCSPLDTAVTYTLSVDDVTLTSDFKAGVDLLVSTSDTTGKVLDKLCDESLTSLGIMLTMSTPNTVANRVYRQNDTNTLAVIKPPTALTGVIENSVLTLTAAAVANSGDWAIIPAVGSYVNIGVWLISANGMLKLLGYKEVQITAGT